MEAKTSAGTVAVLLGAFLLGCGPLPLPVKDAGTAGPVASLVCPDALEPGPTGLAGKDVVRLATADTTDVKVAFCNPLMPSPGGGLVFFVTLADHFGVPASNLTASTWAQSGDRRTAASFAWRGSDLTIEDHHLAGLLTSSSVANDGGPLIGADSTSLVLHLEGIGDNPSLALVWDGAVLQP